MAACRSSLENIEKINLIPVINKNSPRAHTESELDVLGVHGKLVKYVVHSIESTLHRGPIAPVSTPSVLCTLWWGLARKDTSFTPGSHMDLVFFLFFTCLKEKIEKKLFFFTQATQITTDHFLVSRNCRG
jgi:hypothetical protein